MEVGSAAGVLVGGDVSLYVSNTATNAGALNVSGGAELDTYQFTNEAGGATVVAGGDFVVGDLPPFINRGEGRWSCGRLCN